MARFLVRRTVSGALVVLFTSALTFFFVNLAPGGPASISNMQATPEQRAALTRAMGLDRPVGERYITWLAHALHGDLGISLNTDQPVGALVGDRLPNTLMLAAAALALACAAGIPMGVLQAVRRNSWIDHVLTGLSAIGLAIPAFWLGIMLILIFAVSLHALPSAGVASVSNGSVGDRLTHLVLPAITLGMTILPTVVQFMRSAFVNVLDMEYMRTAIAKGVGRPVVLRRHGIPNALIPVVSAIGALIPRLLGGTVVTEVVFGWPGMGRLALDAANGRDYPLVTGIAVVIAAIAVATSVITDLLYTRLDPRVRLAS